MRKILSVLLLAAVAACSPSGPETRDAAQVVTIGFAAPLTGKL